MAANDVIFARVPSKGDPGVFAVRNTDGSNDLTPGMSVKLDGSSLLSTTQPIVGVVRATADDKVFGTVLQNIPKGKEGTVQTGYLALVPALASGAITAGDSVEADTAGLFKTSAGSKFVAGDALTTTASTGDQFLMGVPAQAKV